MRERESAENISALYSVFIWFECLPPISDYIPFKLTPESTGIAGLYLA
jgi:hypothetical protein